MKEEQVRRDSQLFGFFFVSIDDVPKNAAMVVKCTLCGKRHKRSMAKQYSRSTITMLRHLQSSILVAWRRLSIS